MKSIIDLSALCQSMDFHVMNIINEDDCMATHVMAITCTCTFLSPCTCVLDRIDLYQFTMTINSNLFVLRIC